MPEPCLECGRRTPCYVCRENQNTAAHQCGWCDSLIAHPQNRKGGYNYCGPKGDSVCEWLFYERFPYYVERTAA